MGCTCAKSKTPQSDLCRNNSVPVQDQAPTDAKINHEASKQKIGIYISNAAGPTSKEAEPGQVDSNSSDFFYSCQSVDRIAFIDTTIQNLGWVKPDSDLSLLPQISREVYGLEEVSTAAVDLYEAFKAFLKEEAVKSLEGGTLEPVQLPSLLDQVWIIALSFTEEYIRNCWSVFGKTFHRQEAGESSMGAADGFGLTDAEWETDRKTTLWLSEEQYEECVQMLMSEIDLGPRKNLGQVESIASLCKVSLDKTKLVLRRSVPPISFHSWHGKTKESLKDVEEKVTLGLSEIEPCLRTALTMKLPAGNNPEFITELLTEYKRFLVLQYFSLVPPVPSPLLSFVWLTHCSYSLQYQNFSDSVYDSLKPFRHSNWVNGLDACYSMTKKYYTYLFHQEPDEQLWPSVHCQKYRWVSILNLVRTIEGVKMRGSESIELVKAEYGMSRQYASNTSYSHIGLPEILLASPSEIFDERNKEREAPKLSANN